MRIVHFSEIDSTNAEAHRRAAGGERGPLWISADRQMAGRGRLGRSWVSEPGNLYATYLFTIAARAASASQVSFVAALAVYDMAAALLPSEAAALLKLKWPNDVLLDGAKFSGVLPETLAQEGGSRITIAIGCGINLAHAPDNTPYPVTALARHGAAAAPRTALDALSAGLNHWLTVWDEGRGFDAVRQAWLARAAHLGCEMLARQNEAEISGTFDGLEPDGAMILTLADGSRRIIHSGEVRVRTA